MNDMRQVLLHASDVAAAVAEVESHGGSLQHRLSPHLLVVLLPHEVDEGRLEQAAIVDPKLLSETDRLLAKAWQDRGSKRDRERYDELEGKSWDDPGFSAP